MSDPLREVDKAAKEPAESSDDPRVAFWAAEIRLAKDRDKEYWIKAEKVVKLYEGEKHEDNAFNILYANTETLLPSCYNQLPRPFVDRRFHDPDPLAKYGAQTIERALSELMKVDSADYDPFTQLMEQAVLGALLPGHGVTFFKYDAGFGQEESKDDEGEGEDAGTPGNPGDAAPAGQVTGEKVLDVPGEKVEYELVCGEDVDYNEFLCGFARRWAKVPWVARRHLMTREDVEESFGKKWVEKLSYAKNDDADSGGYKSRRGGSLETEAQHGSQPTCLLWEIWNKETREVIFYCPSHADSLIKVIDDPLKIPGFFPCPQPLRFLQKRSKLTPTPLYTLYESQARELNRITIRIDRLVNALKVRGFYDGTLQGLKELMTAGDNTILEAKNAAAMRDGQTLENSIWLMPLDKIITTLRELWPARDQVKETIYEITGIADIMRGEGEASATATQERIKNQWGTLRLKRMQRYVQEYVRDCLQIIASISANHFALETFASMTNLDFAKPDQIKQAQKVMAQVQKMQMQSAQQAQMAPPQQAAGPMPQGPSPAPAPAGPPPLPPEVQKMAEEAQEILSKPPWEPIIELLRDDVTRYYRIDIETNSTIAADTQEDKENITEGMTAIANMYESFLPAVQAGAMTMPMLKSMMLTAVRRFNFGREVEDAIAQIPDQLPPPPPDPSAPTQEEIALKQAQTAFLKQKAQNDAQRDQQELELGNAKHGFEMQQKQIDLAGISRREEADKQTHALKMAQAQAKIEETEATRKATVEKAVTDAFLARQERDLAPQRAAEELRSTQAKNQETERANAAKLEMDLAHQRAEGDQKRDLDRKAAEGKMASDKQASNAKIESDRKASDAKIIADVKAVEKETDNSEVKSRLDEVIRLLKSPAKGKVTGRDAKGKILDVDFSRSS